MATRKQMEYSICRNSKSNILTCQSAFGASIYVFKIFILIEMGPMWSLLVICNLIVVIYLDINSFVANIKLCIKSSYLVIETFKIFII